MDMRLDGCSGVDGPVGKVEKGYSERKYRNDSL